MALTVSESAHKRLIVLFGNHPEAQALRVGIRGGGCSGFSYMFDFDQGAPSEKDKVFDFGDFKVYVDTKSYFHLNGTELDFVEELMGQRFQFNNPNVTATCGCGESISF